MALEDEIVARAKEIKTDGYPMSLGEVISLYREGDIDIHPEFQRIFRWSEDQKSRLIESILLSIPIPPIFVSQRDDGVWDVIDGVQRLSTILEFLGLYRDESGELVPPSTLRATEYLKDLEGYTWEVGSSSFSESLRRDFKRAKLEFRIVRKESDSNAKYDLFQRLNAGSQLSPQEARNCLLVMLNKPMFEEVTRLSQDENFLSSVPLSEAKEDQAYRQELVLRFFIQHEYAGSGSELSQEHGEYITSWMRNASKSFGKRNSSIKSRLFEQTFSTINRSLGDEAFRLYDGTRHRGPFSISCYEFVTTGVATHYGLWKNKPDELAEKIRQVWSLKQFRDNSGTGVSPRRRVPKLVLTAREYFSQV